MQSRAILRYIARIGDSGKEEDERLYPNDPVLAAKVDAILDQEADAFMGLRITRYKGRFGFGFLDDSKNADQLDAAVKSINEEVIPRFFTFF